MTRAKIKKYNGELVISQENAIKKYSMMYIPQANKLSKIAVAIEVLKHSTINEKDLASGFSMEKRQVGYYGDAMRFLGLINTIPYFDESIIGLTKEAYEFFKNKKGSSVDKALAKWIVGNDLLKIYKKRLDEHNEKSEKTTKRRTQSYNAWQKFIKEKLGDK